MCGIVGVAGDITGKEVTVFRDLMYVSGLRGSRSSGVASTNSPRGKDFDWVKITAAPLDLIELPRFDRAVKAPKRLLMGHTRAPTVGDVTNANAQPFLFHNVVGTHNGTLKPWSQSRMPDHEKFGTDSEALIHSIHKRGIRATALDLEGAYAIVWFDRKAGTLNFLRNKERTLSFCYSQDRRCLFWASEPEMLSLALNRNWAPHGEIYRCLEDMMYTFSIPKGINAFDPSKNEKILGAPMPQYTYKPQFSGTGTQSAIPFTASKAVDATTGEPYRARIKSGVYQVWDPKTRTFVPRTLDVERVGPDLAKTAAEYRKKHFLSDGAKVKFYKGFNGEAMDREEYNRRTKDGCAWCSAQADWPENGAPDIIRFINKEDHFCWNCMTNHEALDSVSVINKDQIK